MTIQYFSALVVYNLGFLLCSSSWDGALIQMESFHPFPFFPCAVYSPYFGKVSLFSALFKHWNLVTGHISTEQTP